MAPTRAQSRVPLSCPNPSGSSWASVCVHLCTGSQRDLGLPFDRDCPVCDSLPAGVRHISMVRFSTTRGWVGGGGTYVARLISSNVEDEVLHRPFPFGYIPVGDCNVRNLEFFVCPLWHETRIHFCVSSYQHVPEPKVRVSGAVQRKGRVSPPPVPAKWCLAYRVYTECMCAQPPPPSNPRSDGRS